MRRPAPLTFAVVVATLQAAIGVVAALLGVVGAIAMSASDHAAADGSPNPWSGFGAAIGIAVGLAGLVTAVLLGVPLLVLRGDSPTRRVTGRGLLVGGELLLLLPLVVFGHIRFRTVFMLGADPITLVFDLFVVVPLVVTVCLLVPPVGRWTTAAVPQP